MFSSQLWGIFHLENSPLGFEILTHIIFSITFKTSLIIYDGKLLLIHEGVKKLQAVLKDELYLMEDIL
jgi:hypothetical protein